ncbi:uncharacterized protein LOC117169631 [Belonocnema kinseyi]|uniref:uncharacterized protein LOC117169631 n=1 Tax=Belonocnema kinseyi TaxID=2817044 RepID=UPI00143DB767|nr:uncharacterized protein LOC117169631 [Belonocnema kinseyi]
MHSTTKLKVIILCGLLALALAEDKVKKDTKLVGKKEDKPKRGLDLSLGDHGGYGELSEHGGLSLGGALGPGEHIETEHIKATTITKHVPVLKPYPVHKDVHVPYEVKVKIPVKVDRPYPVHVPQPYPVTVEKHIPYTVEKHIPYPVPYEVKVPVKVPVHIDKHVPYPVYEHSHHGHGGLEGLSGLSWGH